MDRVRLERLIGRNGVVLTEDEWAAVYDIPVRGLLTPPMGNPKIAKGLKLRKPVSTAILHLMPADGSGVNVCVNATDGCKAACLNTAGRGGLGLDAGGLNGIQRARRRRTLQYFARREAFLTRLVREIELHERQAVKRGHVPAVRLNGTSDLTWERIPVTRGGRTFPNMMRAFPRIRFYDYTKRTDRGPIPRNYHLTFSLADGNDADAAVAIANGVNVAAVIRTPEIARRAGTRYATLAPLPVTFRGLRMIDGDKSDVRYADPKGVYVGLRAKGRAVSDTTGFVKDAT